MCYLLAAIHLMYRQFDNKILDLEPSSDNKYHTTINS